eukprot:g11109.t1
MSKIKQKKLEDSRQGTSDLFSFGFEDPSQESDDVQHSNGKRKLGSLDPINKVGVQMGVGASLCGALRAKINEHDWNNGEQLRLGISGEGLPASARKYAKGLQNPPTPARARQPRQVNGRVANDGPAWLVPAGLVLAGEGATDTVGTETYVWKTGDSNRSWREIHEAIGAVVFLKGLVWSP